MMRGVIWDGQRLIVTDGLTVRAPAAGEARVKVFASGICHSDLNMMDAGTMATPAILGHEAAGEVLELGPGVEGFAPGDAVMVGTQAPCGACRECHRGEPANCGRHLGVSSFPAVRLAWRAGLFLCQCLFLRR